MAKKRDRPAVCHNCKTALPARHHGPCPNCGNQVTLVTESVHSERAFKGSIASDARRDFYEGHKPVAVVMILIIFTFPIAGVFIRGVPGLLFGVASSVLGYYLLPYAVHAVRRLAGTD
jgi:hypothetical protein